MENNTEPKEAPNRMATPVDLLYILGTGSRWDDNEMRYSLRGASRFFPHARVFVVGERPYWLRNVEHIAARDPYPHPLKNSIHKLSAALQAEPTLKRFALMNDDFFFLKAWPRLPLYHRGLLSASIVSHPTKRGYYFDGLCWAQARLQRFGKIAPLNYGLHFPMVFDREQVIETFDTFGGAGHGYHFRTMHGNLHNLGGEPMPEVGGRCPLKLLKWSDPKGAGFISTDERVVGDHRLRAFFAERFPEPCQYEGAN